MVEGESGILAVCPRHERPVYHPTTRSLSWPNGAKSLTFSAEDPEQLRGPQHMKLWTDEIAAWKSQTRQMTWDLAMFGTRLGDAPQVVATTTPKPVGLLRDLVDPNVTPGVKITKGTTYENRDNLAPAFFDELITKYEGTRLDDKNSRPSFFSMKDSHTALLSITLCSRSISQTRGTVSRRWITASITPHPGAASLPTGTATSSASASTTTLDW